MFHPLGAKLGKYKHIILIATTLVALGAYLLPLSTVFAGHNNNDNGNTASGTRDKLSKDKSASPSTDSKTKTKGGGSSTSSSGSSTDTRYRNGNSAQLGGPADDGNLGRLNKESDNTGIGNNGIGNTGHHNAGFPFLEIPVG